MLESADSLVVVFVILARLLLPLLIPRFPLPGIIACLLLDAVDQTVFQTFTRIELGGYQSYDKALDVYYLVVAYLSTLRNWQNRHAFQISRFLIYYRLAGVVLFELNQWRPLLLIFPNTFEYFFIFVEGVRGFWRPVRMSRRRLFEVAAAIWVFIKVPQEWWLHVARMDVTDSLKRLFGVAPDAGWGVAIANRPWVLVPIVVVISLAVAAVRYLVVPKLPAPEHTLRLAADPVPEDVDEPHEKRGVFARTRPPWDRITLEKFALITLVSIIFAQILPGLEGHPLRQVLSVAVIVPINAAVSYLLARHNLGWGHVFKQFALMAAINSGLGLADFYLIRPAPPNANVSTTLFLLLLLTLLVTLYDFFRPIYTVRLERPSVVLAD